MPIKPLLLCKQQRAEQSPRYQWLPTLCLFLGLALGVPIAWAHGGGEIQLANAPIGPYKMTVWLNPPQPQAGKTMHITVGLAAPPNDAPVLDATMQVQITRADTQQIVVTTPATTEQSTNKLFYETDFAVAEVGEYEATILVDAPAGGGSGAFPITVIPAQTTNWLLIGLVALALVVLGSVYRNRSRA